MSRKGRDLWGRAAEAQVSAQYEARGGRVVAQRRRTPEGELDLIVAFRDVLVFVEVKARRKTGAALGAVSARQCARLQAAASHFMVEYLAGASRPAGPAPDMRFDVAAVDGIGRVNVVENAIVAGLA